MKLIKLSDIFIEYQPLGDYYGRLDLLPVNYITLIDPIRVDSSDGLKWGMHRFLRDFY